MPNKVININIIIDTTQIMSDFNGNEVSKDALNPTPIGHQYQFMVISDGGSNVQVEGTGDLSFSATQGDVVRFYATSEFNNFDQPVILYDMFKYGGDDVFNNPNFNLQSFGLHTTLAPKTFNPLTIKMIDQDFWFAQNTVNNKGTENYGLKFCL
ncbi:AidA/PixA family protein [uncultured Tenacibaculum sp.]|uniref:AidA/PixA family protein n=1 Tax=uncultured Tenacibaculum sp. TaxID=174713 RepID=UPI00260BB7CE|nr:AidA/PixA family protein [uncultured Tenacibaculum sp.]